jgi:hypothetical protein
LYQPSRTLHLSPSSSRQHNIIEHPSSHRRAHLGRLSSLFQRNNYNTHDAPPRPSFLEWARSPSFHLPHRRYNESIQLQARLPAVVDVPVAKGNYVSPPLISISPNRLYISCRETTQREKHGRRKRKRKQGMQRMHRARRTRRMLLRAAHGPPRAASYSNTAEQLKLSQLHKCMMLSPLCPLHRPLLLLPQPRR